MFDEHRCAEQGCYYNHGDGPCDRGNAPSAPTDTHEPCRYICDGGNRYPSEIDGEGRTGHIFVEPIHSPNIPLNISMENNEGSEESKHDDN